MLIKVLRKKEFGVDRFVPLSEVAKGLISIMARRSTFNTSDLKTLKSLGFDVEIEEEKFNLEEQ
jgi:hypothetical protein